MVQVTPIRTEADHLAALARIDALMDRDGRTATETDELAVLSDLVAAHERRQFPLDLSTPVEAIRFRMEQLGMEPPDLAPYIGGAEEAADVLAGLRPLTLAMIRALHRSLGIPAEVLVQEQPEHAA